ncbi:hypothetical protein ABEB36_013770 [Hypothenemus hampei]|uniref:HTH psq-type domain-containing protein n=1 Tax=Hypothenemus hampei TaxID=57062 RepID=A0ABD1E5J2_HYPHA
MLESVENNPGTNTRRLATEHNVSKSSVFTTPGLTSSTAFLQLGLRKLSWIPNFLLATDEVGFTRKGISSA